MQIGIILLIKNEWNVACLLEWDYRYENMPPHRYHAFIFIIINSTITPMAYGMYME